VEAVVKNVTLAIDENLLQAARDLAASRHTTLNALVRSLLAHEVEQHDRIAWARRGMRELMERSTLEFEPGTNVKDLSRRDVSDQLLRHEHPDLRRGGKAT
jgi:hypothetical protein